MTRQQNQKPPPSPLSPERARARLRGRALTARRAAQVDVRIINYDKLKKRLSLSMKAYTAPAPRDETEDIKGYVDPVAEGAKTAFQLAWERAQSKSLAKA